MGLFTGFLFDVAGHLIGPSSARPWPLTPGRGRILPHGSGEMLRLQERRGVVGRVEWYHGPRVLRHEINQREARPYSTTIAIVPALVAYEG